MSLADLLAEVAKRVKKTTEELEAFAALLEENWYDSSGALAEANVEDVAAIGLPRRLAVEIVQVAKQFEGQSEEKETKADTSSSQSWANDESQSWSKGASSKGKGKSKTKSKTKSKGKGKFEACEFTKSIPVDLSDVNSKFPFRSKLLGEHGLNLKHIASAASVKIDVDGWDSDGRLEVKLGANDEESIEKAANMVQDLVGTVFDESQEADEGEGESAEQSKGKGKSKTKSKGKLDKGKGKGKAKLAPTSGYEASIHINTKGLDSDFKLRGGLVGENGANMRHIEKHSAASVNVGYDTGDGITLTITGETEEAVSTAKDMCEDLVETVLDEAGVSTKSKGKGKGKRKESNDWERPAKAARW